LTTGVVEGRKYSFDSKNLKRNTDYLKDENGKYAVVPTENEMLLSISTEQPSTVLCIRNLTTARANPENSSSLGL